MTKKIVLVPYKHESLTYELSGTVDEVIARLKEAKERLQTEDSVLVLEYEVEHGYYEESDRNVVNLYARRLETDEEYQTRLEQEKVADENRLASKRAQLEQLKKELGEE